MIAGITNLIYSHTHTNSIQNADEATAGLLRRLRESNESHNFWSSLTDLLFATSISFLRIMNLNILWFQLY